MRSIQEAIFERLSNHPIDSLLARRVGPNGQQQSAPGIYDHVPEAADSNAQYPMVVIGDDTAIPFDTDTTVGLEATITIHTFSRYRGRSEVKEIQRSLYEALNRHNLDVDGFHTVDCIWDFSDTLLDNDGITRHGISRFRITTQEL